MKILILKATKKIIDFCYFILGKRGQLDSIFDYPEFFQKMFDREVCRQASNLQNKIRFSD